MRALTASAVFLILLTLGFLIWSLSAPDPRSHGFQSEKERTEIRLKMAHHGILSAILDRETGEAYFVRDGVKCRL